MSQTLKICSCWVLENSKFKLRDNSQDMVKDIRLDCFIIGPDLIIAEHIYLDWQPIGRWFQMPHEEGHLLVNLRVVSKVSSYIGPESADISQVPAINKFGLIHPCSEVMSFDFFLFPFDVLADGLNLLKLPKHLLSTKLYTAHIDVNGPRDSPPSGFGHAAPVFERIGDQGIGWNSGNGFVPVLHLYRS